MKELGVKDLPIRCLEKDMLSLDKQVAGVGKFIMQCETPMTISIQGSWGAGKTSFVNMVENYIKEKEKEKEAQDVVFIYFNSWHFVQFDMSDQLGTSLITALTNELGKGMKQEKQKEKVSKVVNNMEVLKSTGKLTALVANAVLKEKMNVDALSYLEEAGFADADKIFKQEKDTVTAIDIISGLQESLQQVINARLKINEKNKSEDDSKKRVVIFVDDLDRLDPEKAVEVLEILNMFLGCEHCVYLLAVDYEVVISGVAAKYRNTISESKGYEYFEKLIQVVYKIPSKIKQMDEYIAKILGDNSCNKALAAHFAEILRDSGMDNPRAIKRLMNSYILLDKMSEEDGGIQQQESIVLFASLCLRSKCPELYDEFSAMFNKRFNYEKGIAWFNTLHQFCIENVSGYEHHVSIDEEKLYRWHLISQSVSRKDSYVFDRDKMVFLAKFFDSLSGSGVYKDRLGEALNIRSLLNLKRAICWTDMISEAKYSDNEVHYVSKVELVYRGYITNTFETVQGDIEEAYVKTIVSMLDMEKEHNSERNWPQVFKLFSEFISESSKNQKQWKECKGKSGTVWIKVQFDEGNDVDSCQRMLITLRLLSNYLQLQFGWYESVTSAVPWLTGYQDERVIELSEVCFIQIDDDVIKVENRKFDYAYCKTIERLCKGMETERLEQVFEEYADYVNWPEEVEIPDVSFGDVDIIDPVQFDTTEEVQQAMQGITLDEFRGEGAKQVIGLGDDLDETNPWEYETEKQRELREGMFIVKEEDAYFMGGEKDGWMYTSIIDDAQRDIVIHLDVDKYQKLKFIFILSHLTGKKVIWYTSPDMEEYEVMEKQTNPCVAYKNDYLYKNLAKEAPHVFEDVPVSFGLFTEVTL